MGEAKRRRELRAAGKLPSLEEEKRMRQEAFEKENPRMRPNPNRSRSAAMVAWAIGLIESEYRRR